MFKLITAALNIFVIIITIINGNYGQLQSDDDTKFHIINSNQLKVDLPQNQGSSFNELAIFRIGIKRNGNQLEDLEYGVNDIIENNNRIVIKDRKLNLKIGDVINYLLVYKSENGYEAKTGKYQYLKNEDDHQSSKRKRRNTESKSNKSENVESASPEDYPDSDDEEFDPTQSRFGGHGGGGGHRRRNHGNRRFDHPNHSRPGGSWPCTNDIGPPHRGHPSHGRNGPPPPPPHHRGPPPHYGPPPHHGGPPRRPYYGGFMGPPPDYYGPPANHFGHPHHHMGGPPPNKPCMEWGEDDSNFPSTEEGSREEVTTEKLRKTTEKQIKTTTTTKPTTPYVPEIDIRFGDN